jgi:hypothetical protein
MKKQTPPSNKKKPSADPTFEEIKKDLEIPQRTQVPPSEELIEKLNKKAAQPPFSYIHKRKDNNIR